AHPGHLKAVESELVIGIMGRCETQTGTEKLGEIRVDDIPGSDTPILGKKIIVRPQIPPKQTDLLGMVFSSNFGLETLLKVEKQDFAFRGRYSWETGPASNRAVVGILDCVGQA